MECVKPKEKEMLAINGIYVDWRLRHRHRSTFVARRFFPDSSILRHGGIHFVGPGGDAALQISQPSRKPRALQGLDRFRAAAAQLAMHDGFTTGVDLVHTI